MKQTLIYLGFFVGEENNLDQLEQNQSDSRVAEAKDDHKRKSYMIIFPTYLDTLWASELNYAW